MKKAVFFFFFLFSIAGSLAYIPITEDNRVLVEERVTNTSNDYLINYSLDGQEYRSLNASERFGVRVVKGIGLYVIEMDGSVGQNISLVDNNTIKFTTWENPLNPYPAPRVPLRVCVSGSQAMNANRFETDIPYCDHDYEYFLGNVKIGNTYTVRFTEPLYNITSLIWWLGEDDLDGTYGQGGGLPICSIVVVSLSLNQTQAYPNRTVEGTFSAMWSPYQAGCTITSERLQSKDDLGVWRLIPRPPLANMKLRCNSLPDCIVNPASWGVQYKKNISCYKVGNASVRNWFVGTKSGSPYRVASPTRSLECLNEPDAPEPVNNSILAGLLSTENYSITNSNYFPFINYTLFVNGTNKSFSLLSSYNVVKNTGGGSNNVYVNITIDGEELIEEKLRTVNKESGVLDEGVTGNSFFNFTLDEGNHSLIIYFKRDGNGEVEINDVNLVLLQFLTDDLTDVNYEVINPNYDHESVNYSEAYNFTYNSTFSPLAFFGKFTVTNNETALNSYAYKNVLTGDISSYFYRYLVNAGDTGSVGTFGIDENRSELKNYTVLSRVSNGKGTNNASILIFDLEDQDSHSIQHFYAGNSSTNDTANISLSAGTHLISSETLNITAGNGILISGTYSFKSSSGAFTPTFFFNSSNIPLSTCYTKKERFLSSNDDFGNAFYYFVCTGTDINDNNTFNFYVTVPSGETLVLLDESFTGIVTSDLDLTAGFVPLDLIDGFIIFLMFLVLLMMMFIVVVAFKNLNGEGNEKT